MAAHTLTAYMLSSTGRAYLLNVDGVRWSMARAWRAWKAGDTFVTPTAVSVAFRGNGFLCTADVAVPNADQLTGLPQQNLWQLSPVDAVAAPA